MSRSLSTPDSISEVLFLDLKPEQLEKSLINFHIHMSHPPWLTSIRQITFSYLSVKRKSLKQHKSLTECNHGRKEEKKVCSGLYLNPYVEEKFFRVRTRRRADGWMERFRMLIHQKSKNSGKIYLSTHETFPSSFSEWSHLTAVQTSWLKNVKYLLCAMENDFALIKHSLAEWLSTPPKRRVLMF